MLERAAKCFNQGRLRHRHVTRTELLLSRRMLHSAFWRHGAGDLDLLPTWCFPVLSNLFEGEPTTALDSVNPAIADLPTTSPLLNLLYPEQAKHLVKRISVLSWRQWRRSIRRCYPNNLLRAFTSTTDLRQLDNPVVSRNTENSGASRSIRNEATAMKVSEPLQKLHKRIDAHRQGEDKQSMVTCWKLYQSLDPRERTPGLTQAVIQILASSPWDQDARRAIDLFESIPLHERQPHSYAMMITAMLRLRRITSATSTLQQALDSHVNPTIAGADTLLMRLIEDRHWQLVFTIWRRCVEHFEDTTFLTTWKTTFLEKVPSTPGYHANVMSLLYAIEEFPNAISPEADKRLVVDLVRSAFQDGNHFGAWDNRRVLSIMRQLNVMDPSIVPLAISRSLDDTHSSQRERTKCAMEIYRDATSDERSKRGYSLTALSKAASQAGDQAALIYLYEEWRSLYGRPPFTLIGSFLKCFAARADIAKVDTLLESYISGGHEQSLKLHYPVLHVRALRSDPNAVREHMTRMELREGLKPDTDCWNILLNAYYRVNDLDGALNCMSGLLEAGLAPNEYTIGTLMAAALERNDVHLVEQLYQSTALMDIPKNTVINDCMVLALLNSNRPMQAEKLATAETLKAPRSNSTRMWNQILMHHCLQKPPTNVTSTLRVAAVMQKNRVPFNSYSYAAMMRAYVVAKRPDFARRILNKVLINRGMPVIAFHFAIVIDGYVQVMAFDKAMRVHTEMLRRGIKPDISSNLALLNLQTVATRNKILLTNTQRAGVRADIPEEVLEELLSLPDPQLSLSKEPRLSASRSRFSRLEAWPAVYFTSLFAFYGKIRSFDMVKSLLSKYERKVGRTQGQKTMPLRFLSQMMLLLYRRSEHAEVERYWKVAKDIALKVSKPSELTIRSLGTQWISPSHRYLLALHFHVYMRSLDAQRAFDKIKEEINSLLALGFDLDNRNWNLYVQLLATRKHYIDAFTLCESHLMPAFPGWGSQNEYTGFLQTSQRKSPGMEFRGSISGYYLLSPGQLQVTYATVVRFSITLKKLREEAPFDKRKRLILDEIEAKAPLTLRAVETMPRVQNNVTKHLVPRRRVQSWKRKVPSGAARRNWDNLISRRASRQRVALPMIS